MIRRRALDASRAEGQLDVPRLQNDGGGVDDKPRSKQCRVYITRGMMRIIFGIILFTSISLVYTSILLKLVIPTTSRHYNPTSLNEGHDNVIYNSRRYNSKPKTHLASLTHTKRNPQIPRRLIFTYKYNLIAPSKDDPPFDPKDPLTANVLKTIDIYTNFWKISDLAERSRMGHHVDSEQQPNLDITMPSNSTNVVVSFLSDVDCIEAIEKSEPRLVPHFQNEARGEFKADICRVAALYLEGGYYFDIDIGVVAPINFDFIPIQSENPLKDAFSGLKERRKYSKLGNLADEDSFTTFASVYNKAGRLFQAFTAAMPQHPVLQKALEYLVAYYEGYLEAVLPQFILEHGANYTYGIPSRKKPQGLGVGPLTLKLALRATEEEEWEKFARSLLDESNGKSSYGVQTSLNSAVANDVDPSKKYSRFLYEISLEDKLVKQSGIFKNVPLQDANYVKKVRWCNFVCFEGAQVYFYSRIKGSKGCPLEK
ncbi:hypothetical protein ACHAXS_011850 [Conticribra weissflogii]